MIYILQLNLVQCTLRLYFIKLIYIILFRISYNMSYTTPPSPRWNDTDVNYPNIALAPDNISCST